MRFVAAIDTRIYGRDYPQGAEVDTAGWNRKQLLQFLGNGLIQASYLNAGSLTDALEFSGVVTTLVEGGKLLVTIEHDALLALTDVDVSTPPTSGQVLAWDSVDEVWRPADAGTGGGSLNAEDVRDIVGATLTQTGSVTITVDDAGDVIEIGSDATANATDDYLLDRENHTGTQEISTVAGLEDALGARVLTSALTELVQDIIGSSLVEGSNVTITYDDVSGQTTIASTGGGGGGGATTLDELDDVETDGATAGQLLAYDGALWGPVDASEGGGGTSGPAEDLIWTAWTPVISSSGGGAALGSTGAASGVWTNLGGLMIAQAEITFDGSGASAGSGVLYVTVPAAFVDGAFASTKGYGAIYAGDNANIYVVTAQKQDDTHVRFAKRDGGPWGGGISATGTVHFTVIARVDPTGGQVLGGTSKVQGLNRLDASAATITSSTYYASGYEPTKVFDQHPSSCWASDGVSSTQWIAAAFATAHTVTEYVLRARTGASSNIEQTPTAWTLAGSNDGVTWTTVDTRASQIEWGGGEAVTYTVATPGSYLRYRLTMTANAGTTSYYSLAELVLFESVQALAAPGPGVRGCGATTLASSTAMTANRTYLKKVTLGAGALGLSIDAFLAGNGVSVGGASAALFSDVAGAPGLVLAYSGVPVDSLAISTTGRWLSFPLSRWLPAGDYWVAVAMLGESNSDMSLGHESGADSHFQATGAWHADAGLYTVSASGVGWGLRLSVLEQG